MSRQYQNQKAKWKEEGRLLERKKHIGFLRYLLKKMKQNNIPYSVLIEKIQVKIEELRR